MSLRIAVLCGMIGISLSACETHSQIAQDRMNASAIQDYMGEVKCRQADPSLGANYAACRAQLERREVKELRGDGDSWPDWLFSR